MEQQSRRKSVLTTAASSIAMAAMLCATSTSTQAASTESLYSQQFFSMKICGSLSGKLDATQSAGLNAKVDGFGSLGIDFYGNALKAKITPSVGIDTKASSSAFSKIDMVSCIDLIKLAKFLEKESVTTEAEQALLDAMSVFDPDELRTTLVNVAYLTGMEPGRMLGLLERIPGVAEEISAAATSGDPLDLLRSVSTLSDISEDLPLPPVVRERLGDMEGRWLSTWSRASTYSASSRTCAASPLAPDCRR